MNYHDLKKQSGITSIRSEPGLNPHTHENLISEDGEIGTIWGVGIHAGPSPIAGQRAAVVCHCVNKFDKALEALKELAALNRATPFSMFEFAAKAQALAESLEPTGGKGLVAELEEVK